MADTLRIVSFSAGGKAVQVMNLDDATYYIRLRDTFKFTPAAAQQQVSSSGMRYGGSRVVGESHTNGSIQWQLLVKGLTYDQAASRIETVLANIESALVNRYVEWIPDGMSAARSSYFEICGPGSWEPGYRWAEWHGSAAMPVTITFPVRPLVEWARMAVMDTFTKDQYSAKQDGFTNLITDPSMESGAETSSEIIWAIYQNGGTATMATSTTQVRTGANSLRLVATSAITDMGIALVTSPTTAIRVDPGQRLSAFGYTRANSTTRSTSCLVVWYDGGFTQLSTTQISTSNTTNSSGAWTRTGIVSAVAPANNVYAVVYVVINGPIANGEIHYVDDAIAILGTSTELNTLGYFSGDTNTGEWSGTPNRSTSYELTESKLADYTFDAGSATELRVVQGRIVPSNTGGKYLNYSGRGYAYADNQATLRTVTGASVATFEIFVRLKRIDPLNYLMAGFSSAGTTFGIYTVIAGIPTLKVSSSVALSANTQYWVRGRIEGNMVYAEYFTTEPTPMGTPTATLSFALSGSDADRFGVETSGGSGFRIIPGGTDWRYGPFSIDPYVNRNRVLPDIVDLKDVPGTAPARVDIVTTPSGGAAAPAWALFGWSQKPVCNLLANGSFEDDVSGWSTTAGTHNNASTSFTRITTGSKYGTSSASLVTTVTNLSGAWIKLLGRFRKGVPYTFTGWLASSTTNKQVQVFIGSSGTGGDSAAASAITGSSSLDFKVAKGVWTPSADRDDVVFGVRMNDGVPVVMTIRADGLMVYEGATVPTIYTQTEGRGAQPAIGIIEAENGVSADLVGWANVADAGSRSGFRIHDSTVSGAETYAASWVVDPHVVPMDDFSRDELEVEVWARVMTSSALVTPKLTLSVRPFDGVSFGAERFTSEYGSVGKTCVIPSSSTAWRMVRLGTIMYSVKSTSPRVVKLWITGSTATGSTGEFGIDYLICIPSRNRATGPTSKIFDSSYPKFVSSTSETSKTVRSDLTGAVAKPPQNAYPDHGLGGSLIELPAGNVQVVCKLSNRVPDDPTVDTSSDQEEHAATVQFNVVPRSRMMRSE